MKVKIVSVRIGLKEYVTPIFSSPTSISCKSIILWRHSSALPTVLRAKGSNSAPDSVSTTLWLLRMKSLVQEMLDLTRVEQAEIIHHNETSPARNVVTQVVNNFQMIYPDFKFLLDDDLRSEKEVAIFRDHFEQLLIIIIDNAVKYSTDKKVVHVSLSSNPHEIEIAIQDFGEGISQQDLTKIFNRFYRVDKARSRHKGGNGLGLSIAQKLVETYHGHLSVESVLGQGTIFHIEIPLVEHESSSSKAF